MAMATDRLLRVSRRARNRRVAPVVPQAKAQWRTIELGAYAAFVFLVALVFSTRLEAQFSLPKLLIIRIFTSIFAGVWLVRFSRDGTRRLPRAVGVAVAALGLWWVLSTLTAVHPPTALNGAHGRYNGLWTQLMALSFFLIAASSRFGVADVERLTKCLVAALALAASYALVQFAGWDPIAWPGQRSASTIGNPVVLAAVLGLALPFALVFLLLAGKAGQRVAWTGVLAILLAGSISTLSRGPLAASAAALMLVLSGVAWEHRQRISRWLVLGVVVVATIGLVVGYRQVIQTRESLTGARAAETERTLLDRFNTYAVAIQIVRDHPITGVGPENFSVVYPRYRSAESERLTPDVLPTMVHNGYLQAAATTGIPGLLAYLVLIASVLIVLVRRWAATHERRERWLILAFIAAVVGYLIQDLSGWLEISLSALFWLVLGLGLALASPSLPATAITPLRRRVTMAAVGGAALLAGGLAVQTAAALRVDYLLWNVQALSPRENWPAIEAGLSSAVVSAGRDAVYLDKAALRYADRYAVSGMPAAYDRAASLFDQARQRDPFHPYIQIHRLALETVALEKTLALEKKAVAAGRADSLASDLMALDPNNAAVHEAVARLRLAQGRPGEAAQVLSRAKALRPSEGRYDELEGDIDRAMNNRVAAVEAYRAAIARYEGGDTPAWIGASHKMIVMLLEQGQSALAIQEAQHLVGQVPGDGLGHSLLGYAYVAIKDATRARAAFEAALRINPGDQNARQGLSEVSALPNE